MSSKLSLMKHLSAEERATIMDYISLTNSSDPLATEKETLERERERLRESIRQRLEQKREAGETRPSTTASELYSSRTCRHHSPCVCVRRWSAA